MSIDTILLIVFSSCHDQDLYLQYISEGLKRKDLSLQNNVSTYSPKKCELADSLRDLCSALRCFFV